MIVFINQLINIKNIISSFKSKTSNSGGNNNPNNGRINNNNNNKVYNVIKTKSSQRTSHNLLVNKRCYSTSSTPSMSLNDNVLKLILYTKVYDLPNGSIL